MKKDSFLYRVFDLYYDGFRNMKLGRTLWTIILIKLFIIFAASRSSSSLTSSAHMPRKGARPTM